MGIYAKRMCPFKSPLEHAIPYPMHVRPTRQTVDNIVRFVVQPCAIVDFLVCRFRCRQEGEVCHNPLVICDHKASVASDVCLDNLFRRITVDPLVHISRSVHHLPRRIYYRHDSRDVVICRKSDGTMHTISNRLLLMVHS